MRYQFNFEAEPFAAYPELEVFQAPGYELLVRPTGPAEGEILLVRSAPEGEEEVYDPKDPKAWRKVGREWYRVRGPRVSLEWSGPFDIGRPPSSNTTQLIDPLTSQAAMVKRPGVYIATFNNAPKYVGESKGLSGRWVERCRIIGELELTVDLKPYQVWLGAIRSSDVPKVTKELEWLLGDLEHVLIRELKRAGAQLTNRTSVKEILAAPLKVRIGNDGKRPPSWALPSRSRRSPRRTRWSRSSDAGAPRAAMQIWKPWKKSKSSALLHAIEQYFIDKMEQPGNKTTECIEFQKPGTFRLWFNDERKETIDKTILVKR
jgi:hypothetical protein